jgi:mRNA-degrading endonuclease HigB of HigAB toxin-antitoxin module
MVNYKCEICGKISTQKSHHDAHLKSKEHKLKSENLRMKIISSKSLKEILEEYPQFKSEVEELSEGDFLLDGDNEQDNIEAVKNAEKHLKYEIVRKIIRMKSTIKMDNKKSSKMGNVLELIQNLIKQENNFENIL